MSAPPRAPLLPDGLGRASTRRATYTRVLVWTAFHRCRRSSREIGGATWRSSVCALSLPLRSSPRLLLSYLCVPSAGFVPFAGAVHRARHPPPRLSARPSCGEGRRHAVPSFSPPPPSPSPHPASFPHPAAPALVMGRRTEPQTLSVHSRDTNNKPRLWSAPHRLCARGPTGPHVFSDRWLQGAQLAMGASRAGCSLAHMCCIASAHRSRRPMRVSVCVASHA